MNTNRNYLSRRNVVKAAGAGVALAVSAACFGPRTAAAEAPGHIGEDTMLELAKRRRSIRKYTNEPIDRATLDAILKTALLAPASHGKKVVEFVVVEDKDTLDALARCKRIGAPSVRAATVAIVVIVDTNAELWIEDGAVASTYLLLAAEYHGIGACWNHIRGRQGQSAPSEEEIRQLLGIPVRYAVLNIVAMGHKGENKAAYTDDSIPLKNIHRGKFAS